MLWEYAAHAGAAAATYAFGRDDSALWTEVLQCLVLVLKRSLLSILVKNVCTKIG